MKKVSISSSHQNKPIQYTRKNTWSSGVFIEEGSCSNESMYAPSQHAIRSMNLAKKDEPSFKCPACKGRFNLSYGKYGHLSSILFSPNCLWCRDCFELNNCIKM